MNSKPDPLTPAQEYAKRGGQNKTARAAGGQFTETPAPPIKKRSPVTPKPLSFRQDAGGFWYLKINGGQEFPATDTEAQLHLRVTALETENAQLRKEIAKLTRRAK